MVDWHLYFCEIDDLGLLFHEVLVELMEIAGALQVVHRLIVIGECYLLLAAVIQDGLILLILSFLHLTLYLGLILPGP